MGKRYDPEWLNPKIGYVEILQAFGQLLVVRHEGERLVAGELGEVDEEIDET